MSWWLPSLLSCGGWDEPPCSLPRGKVVASRLGHRAEEAQMEQRRHMVTHSRAGHPLEQTGALAWELLRQRRPQLLPTVG